MKDATGSGAPRNLLLRLAYDGTDYFGWQIQPHRPTIQGSLAAVLAAVAGHPVEVHGAGRTDAGVHACGQAANVHLASPIPCAGLLQILNDRLPESIRVLSVEEVPVAFHARRAARSKIYRYRIFRAPIAPPWLVRYVHPFPYPLDEQAMIQAAAQFGGTQDFRSFASSDASSREARAQGSVPEEQRSAVRTIYSSALQSEGEELVYTVEGSGFLHHMVRNIVGTLLETGRGNFRADQIAAILAARDRSAAGPTAPARGLHLMRVLYPDFPEDDSGRNLADDIGRMS